MKNKTRWYLRKKLDYAIKDLIRALRQITGVREVVAPVHEDFGELLSWCEDGIDIFLEILTEMYEEF